MPPKKAAAAAAAAVANDASDELFQLKTSELLWTRDKFISGLSNLEQGVNELRRAYISHFNTLLPEGHPGRVSLPFFTSFDGAGTGLAGAGAAAGANAEANTKKKRKPHDPNAPKRALTSYFLFMQHNKPQIKEAHPDWEAKQVAEESERRWNNISEADKQKYEYMYQVDLARYYKQKEAYESGHAVPEISAEEATRLYNEHLKSGVPFKGRKGRKLTDVPAPGGVRRTSSDSSSPEPPPAAKRQKKSGAAPTPKAAPAAKMKGTPKAAEVSKTKPANRKSKGADAAAMETASPKKDAKKPAAKGKRKSAAE